MFVSSLTYYFYIKTTDEVVECDFDRWQELAKEHGTCQVVQQDTFPLKCGNDVTVSTICLPFDHNDLGGYPRPLIFETMTFSENKKYDCNQRRDSTLEQAIQTHNDWIEEIKKEQDNES